MHCIVWGGRNPGAKALIQLSGPEHTRRRRPWNRAFNVDAVKGYEEILQKRAEQLAQRLGQQIGNVNLTEWISWFSFDFMSDMALVLVTSFPSKHVY